LIDGIDRNTVEEEVKKQIDYDCLISHPDSSVVQMAEEIKDLTERQGTVRSEFFRIIKGQHHNSLLWRSS